MKAIERDGVRLFYEESGSGGPPLVFVHGWCCDHTHFAPQMRHFCDRHRVVSLDQRGFGASSKPAQEYTIEGHADDLAWLCGELGLERPLIVGHSLGGAVALATAARHPALPAALALCDPAVFLPSEARVAVPELIAALEGPGYRDAAAAFIGQALFHEGDDSALRARITAAMLETPPHVMRSSLRNLHAFDEAAAARGCRVPVLAIEAETPIAQRERFEAACPQLRVARTPGVGHFLQLLAAERVNGLLEDFLAEELLP